jgi:hypothetical protein
LRGHGVVFLEVVSGQIGAQSGLAAAQRQCDVGHGGLCPVWCAVVADPEVVQGAGDFHEFRRNGTLLGLLGLLAVAHRGALPLSRVDYFDPAGLHVVVFAAVEPLG